MIHTLLVVGFAVCAGEVLYTYLGYAGLVYVASRVAGRTAKPPVRQESPRLALIIAAYNEQAVIGDRLRNALESDYPAERWSIFIGSDGSDDATADVVRAVATEYHTGPSVRLVEFPRRRGKAAVLNDCVAQARAGGAEVIVFSDANTFHDADAIARLSRWFADPRVGAVCGRLVLSDAGTGQNVDGIYWKCETFLKRCEARLGALLGANGAIYAVRAGCFVPIPDGTIVDDFVIPLVAKVRHGCGLIYDADAVAREETAPDVAGEFRRRVRIGAGGFQSVGLLWRLMDPRRGWVALAFVSHKLLRWLCPFALGGMLLCSAGLWNVPMFRLMLGAQVLLYLAAAAGPWVPGRGGAVKVLRLATMFTGMNLALLLGFFRWMGSTPTGTWQRTARPDDSAALAPGGGAA